MSFDGDICGLNGGIKRFQADQTTEKCDPMKPGAISGLYNGKNTTTELIGAGNALLYQVFNNVNGVDTLEHSQLTTLTTLADGRSVFDLLKKILICFSEGSIAFLLLYCGLLSCKNANKLKLEKSAGFRILVRIPN